MKDQKNWVFTLNNYTSQQEEVIRNKQQEGIIKYVRYGKEIAPTTGTPHLQGYIQFTKKITLSSIKKKLGINSIHLKPAMGTLEDNIKYTGKDGDITEYGEPTRERQRTDLRTLKEKVKQGLSMEQIIDDCENYQQLKYVELLKKHAKMPEPMKRTIKWYYGSTGCGKTRKAVEEAQGDYYITMNSLKWWDGYDGQKVIIIDDFRRDFCTFHELLRILDRYPYRVNVKGGSIWLSQRTETIIITAPLRPEDIYETREDVQQLLRRIDIVERIGDQQNEADIKKSNKRKSNKRKSLLLVSEEGDDPLEAGVRKLTASELEEDIITDEETIKEYRKLRMKHKKDTSE